MRRGSRPSCPDRHRPTPASPGPAGSAHKQRPVSGPSCSEIQGLALHCDQRAGGTRTLDRGIRNPVLYPTELPAQPLSGQTVRPICRAAGSGLCRLPRRPLRPDGPVSRESLSRAAPNVNPPGPARRASRSRATHRRPVRTAAADCGNDCMALRTSARSASLSTRLPWSIFRTSACRLPGPVGLALFGQDLPEPSQGIRSRGGQPRLSVAASVIRKQILSPLAIGTANIIRT